MKKANKKCMVNVVSMPTMYADGQELDVYKGTNIWEYF